MALDGLTPFSGQVTQGLRGNSGGENASWGIDPRTGQEVPAIMDRSSGQYYLLPDLMQKFGSIDAIRAYGFDKSRAGGDGTDNYNPYYAEGPFAQSIDLFGARPSNDTFSGKDGLRDLATIGLMAAPVGLGAAGAFGAASTGTAAVGDAAVGGGTGLSSLSGGATELGGGLSTGSTAGGIGGGATGTGLTAGTTATGLGAGVTGTGLAGTTATGALAPGYFAAESAYPIVGGATSAAAGSAGAGSTGGAVGGSALAGLGGLTAADLARGIPGTLGALAAKNQSDQLTDLAHEYMNLGGPSRARFESSFAPGFSMASDPGFTDSMNQSAKATLHGLSVSGNPADSPNAWAKSLQDLYEKNAYPALQNYRTVNAGAGGLASLTGAAPAVATAGVNANANVANGLGGAAADIFTPRKSLSDLMREAYGAR